LKIRAKTSSAVDDIDVGVRVKAGGREDPPAFTSQWSR
jgi:hypothetical protein